MTCKGSWGFVEVGKYSAWVQITPDTCIPRENCNGCQNHCPANCNALTDQVCPGPEWTSGGGQTCKGPDRCHPADLECPKY